MKNSTLHPVTTLIAIITCLFALKTQSQVSGELKKWHTVNLTFEGPETSEDAATNPFLDYRLNVTFIAPSGAIWLVPGFYAADGNAANSGADFGSIWQVRFSPNEIGLWSYQTSFRTGSNIAISINENEGVPISFNGASGNFTISASDKQLPDNRAKGRLKYVGGHYLQFEETERFFIKVGSDSPENLLAFSDFDNTVDKKDWAPHVQDWQNGDPTWKENLGRGLIGAVNYLSNQGMNAFSFLTMSVEGDGKDVWPWAAANNNDLDGNSGTDAQNRLRYDVSKLEQWEILFSHADTKGMFLHFKTQETENDQLIDGGALGTERRLYYRELIARFGHHLALNWNVGEENTNTTAQRRDFASYIKSIDPYDHHLVIHTFPNQQDQVYEPLLGNVSDYTGPSVQTDINNVHRDVKRWVEDSRNSGKRWAVANDEQGNAQTGVTGDNSYSGDTGSTGDNRKQVRHQVLWGTLLAGGYGVEYYFGYSTGETDLTAEDFRSRRTKWEDAKVALDFFTENIPFWEMESSDNLVSDNDAFCFSKQGETYVIYLPDGGSTNLNLMNQTGTFSLKWFDPIQGGDFETGSLGQIVGGGNNSIGNPPRNSNQDWVVLIEKTTDENTEEEESGDEESEESTNECPAGYAEEGGLLIIEIENLAYGNGWELSTQIPGYSGNAYLAWEGSNNFNTPGNGLISVPIQINDPGTYRFRWRSKVGEGTNPTESNDSWLRFPDADDFYGEKNNGSIVYPKGSGKTPTAEGSGADGWFKIYSSGTTDWTWTSKTSDNDSHDIYVRFNNAGTYLLEISGRSKGHFLDRIALSKDFSDATDLSLPESTCKSDDEDTTEEEEEENSDTEEGGEENNEGDGDDPDMDDDTQGDNGDDSNDEENDEINNEDQGNSEGDEDNVDMDDETQEDNGNGSSEEENNDEMDGEDQNNEDDSAEDMTIAINSLEISPSAAELNIGETLALSAIIIPENATDKSLIWSSSNESVATVDENGLITATGLGTTTITASAQEGEIQQGITINVVSEEGLVLFPNPATASSNINLVGMAQDTYEINIYTLSGALVKKKLVEINGAYNLEIQGIQEGLYILTLRSFEKEWTRKVLIR